MNTAKLVGLLGCAVILSAPLRLCAADYVQPRAGLGNAFQKFAESQQTKAYTKITYFGGSITAGAGASKPELCWRSLLHKQLRAEFPGATLAENNAAIGGTGSWLGAFRTRNQALYGGAALVIVEFAVNDGGDPEPQVLAAMEGIVRQIWQTDATCDILFVYTLNKHMLDEYQAGRVPATVQWHERVAAHYGIPSVNMGAFVAQKIQAGELAFADFSKDGAHPTDRGHALYFEALKPFIAQCKAAARKPVRHAMPKPLTPAPMEHAQCVPYEWAQRSSAWSVGQKSPCETFMHILASDQPGATLTLKFKGAQCGVFDFIGAESGALEVALDGGAWQLKTRWDDYCKQFSRANAMPLAQGLDPAQWHELKLRVAEKQPAGSTGRVTRIGFLLVDGEVEEPFKGLDPLQRLDAVWKTIEQPLKIQLAADRWQQIPQTLLRLREGGTLRIVMLGDSIIGDTSSSKYELLLQRLYPKCKIEKITSTRGSTGCWWYQDENRIEGYVLKHKPDLLMIGGISQRGDTEAIRSVIRQVRAQQPCEVLLMTPAFGALPDPHIKNWRYDIDPASDDYRARLLRLAAEEKCAFLDMTGPWWQFVKDSGCDYGWFQRDRVHANERGHQILGRILEKYFAP